MMKALILFILLVVYAGIFWMWPAHDAITFHGNIFLAAVKLHLVGFAFLVLTVAAMLIFFHEPVKKPEEPERKDTEEEVVNRGECPRHCPHLRMYFTRKWIGLSNTPDEAYCAKYRGMRFMQSVGGGIDGVLVTPYRTRQCVADGYIPPREEVEKK